MDDPQLVGFGQSFGHLANDGQSRTNGDYLHPMDQALQVLSADVLHRQIEGLPLLVEVKHTADVFMGDLAGRLDLVTEAFDHPLLCRDLRLDELEGDFLVKLGVLGPVDASHTPDAQLLNDLVAAGKDHPPGEFSGAGFERPGKGCPVFGALGMARC